MAGTTWPAGPPASPTTLAASGTARSTPSTRGRAPTLDDAQFAGAGGPPAGDVEDQAHREQRGHQTAVAIGDEGEGNGGERSQAHHGEGGDGRRGGAERGGRRG